MSKDICVIDEIFPKIDTQYFILYSCNDSLSNTPVNAFVSILIPKYLFELYDEKLEGNNMHNPEKL